MDKRQKRVTSYRMRQRLRHLNVRVDADELAKLRALAADRDVPVSTLIRHFVRDAYAARFGDGAAEVHSPEPGMA